MNQNEIAEHYGPQVDDDSRFKQKCRLLQSWYRVAVLKQSDYGRHQLAGRCVGSALVNGEATGANFLSLAARACAWEKLAEKELVNPDLMVERYRLFNNMLSSQPMCFNLFADLRLGVRHGRGDANRIVAAIFEELPIASVEQLEIEMLPQDKYIGDKTAFDAAVFYTDRHGRTGLISVETKYTDKLGGNSAASETRQQEMARELGLFNDEGLEWYNSHQFDQIVRNLLLTVAYGHRHELGSVRHCVLAPHEDEETTRLITGLRRRLAPKYYDAVMLLSLEAVIRRGLCVADGVFKDHLREFNRRYLDFGHIEDLLAGR